MSLDFQIEPFFDDYSEDKKFHRILFRPGYAVQARELTQLQTILQQQIRRHGDHVFKEGAMVIPGQISYDLDVPYVKLSFDAGVDAAGTLKALVGKEITNSSGLIAKVINYAVAEGSDLNTIFVKYQNSIQVNGVNVSEFYPYEVLTPVDNSTGLDVTVADTYKPTGIGCSASIERGIYYIKKNFVLVTGQSIILDKYDNTPSYRVGLALSESFVYPEEDESLLDNALGSPNYSAPGAARYSMDLVLSKLSLTTTADADFIDLLRLRDGKVLYKIDRTTYAEIEKTLARRTYDESGDYTVKPFKLQNREFRNNLRGDWARGERFIQGDLIKVPDGTAVGFYYFVAVTSGVSGSTRPTFSTTSPSITDNQISWEYMTYPNFNQGINTFTAGDSTTQFADVDDPATVYSVSDFTLDDHIRLDGMLALGVEAGKAYVRGYEIEKLATEYIPVQKSRHLPAGSNALCAYFGLPAGSLPEVTDSVSVQKTANIDVSMGAYIIVNSVLYLPNLTTLPYVNLHSAVRTSADTTTIIGKTRIRGIEKHNDTSYKVFLFDTTINAGKTFGDIKSIYTDSTHFQCNTIQTNGVTVLQEADKSSAIFSLPDYAVNNVSEVTYSVVVPFTKTASGNKVTFSAPIGYTFESASDSNNYLITDNNDGSIVSNAVITVKSAGSSLELTSVANHSFTILATLKRADATTAFARRTVTDAVPMQLTTAAAAQAGTIKLNHSYVTRIISVKLDSRGFVVNGAPNTSPLYNTNITNRYTFDNGQKITHIDASSITLVPGAIVPNGPILIEYEYLASVETAGDIITVNSYTHSTSKMRYDQIVGVSTYVLRDSVDFRPYAIGGGFAEKYFPKYGTTASIKYNHHLGRTDIISLSSTGAYLASRGIPSLDPAEPAVPQESMKLASIDIEPYTFLRDTQSGISINRVENKRYTMRDIGKLERRISDLEYYTSLTLTELDTKNMRIIDSNGLDRFQNGFLVDSFTGQGVGNPASDDWNASIDTAKKELRPFVSQRQISLLENVNAATRNYKVSGDLVTLPFSEVELISQPKSSRFENLNPYNIGTYRGIININPWSDTWFSTHYRPDIVLTDESQYLAIVAKAKQDGILGTIYNSVVVTGDQSKATTTKQMTSLGKWSTADTKLMNTGNNGGSFWRNRATFTIEQLDFIGNTNHNIGSDQANSVAGTRVVTYDVVAVPLTKTFTGTTTTVTEKFDSRIAEERIVDTQVVPYIRPRAVLFTGFGFRATTNMYGYFDNILVNDYITPATRLKVTAIAKPNTTTNYPSAFDVERNAGSAVSNKERTVLYSDGTSITGTVYIDNGSNVLNGTATSFSSEVLPGDIINFGGGIKYTVDHLEVIKIAGEADRNSNTKLYFTQAWTGATIAQGDEVSVKVIGPKHTSEEVEIAFNHGEVIKEVNGNGNTCIVVGQEIYLNELYVYVLNIKGTGVFSTAANAYLEGEYTTASGDKARVKFVERTDFTTLTTSFTGQLNGIFRIPSSPALKFKTGRRELRFSSSNAPSAVTRAAQELTGGGTYYEATGTVEVRERTIISTRTADLQSVPATTTQSAGTSTTNVQTGDTGWFDPLAQTFLVQQDGGAFITSVDLYFNTKDEKIPMRIEIREVVNGYPGRVVLPFSRVEKKASQILTSIDATVPTTFKFSSPVFLQNDTEYALVALSDSNLYTVWISQTLEVDVTTKAIIASQPYNGVLFKSQNASTWTADQTQDLKFTIRRASFVQSPVSIELVPPTIDYKSLDFNPLEFTAGSRKCRVNHENHGMIPGEYVMLKSRQVISSINGISATNIFEVPLQILTADLDSYVVEFGGTINSTTTGSSGGGYLAASENFEFETTMLDVGELIPPGTSIDYQLKTIDHTDAATIEAVTVKTMKDFDTARVYPSTLNYSNSQFPSGLSVIATLNPGTLNSLSPVIDLGKVSLTMVSNKIDDPSVEINDPTLDVKTIGTLLEIGSGKQLELIDINGDTIAETLVVDGTNTAAATLFRDMNNNLNVGNLLKLTYTGVTNAVNYFIIVDKRQDADGKLYFTLEAENALSELIETGIDQTVDIIWLTRFKSEYAPLGGSTHSKYVTKKINFSRPSEMLKIMFSAQIPAEAEVDIYYKTGVNIDGDFISSRYYKAVPDTAYQKSNSEFVDITSTIENLEPFDSVMVKLVMRSINKAKVPHIKDFRVIACAA